MRQVVSTDIVFSELLWFDFGRFVFDRHDRQGHSFVASDPCCLMSTDAAVICGYIILKGAGFQDINAEKKKFVINPP